MYDVTFCTFPRKWICAACFMSESDLPLDHPLDPPLQAPHSRVDTVAYLLSLSKFMLSMR